MTLPQNNGLISKYNWIDHSKIDRGGADGTLAGFLQPEGYYYLSFQKIYQHLTDEELEFRYVLARELISDYTNNPADVINFKEKQHTQVIGGLDEVFWVRKGQVYIGKVSLRSQLLADEFTVTIIYWTKKVTPELINRKGFRKIKPWSDKSRSRRGHIKSDKSNTKYRKRRTTWKQCVV